MKRKLLIPILVIALVACNKNSNELVPIKSQQTFVKEVLYNGTVVLIAQVNQYIKVGDDSIKIKISNASGQSLDSITLGIYFQTSDNLADALKYKYKASIKNLALNEHTTIVINSKPILPITTNQVFIVILSARQLHSNFLNGFYDGTAGYYFNKDTVASKYSSLKGIIQADGSSSFWMNINNTDKKLTGKLLDSTYLENGFYSDTTIISTVALDTIKKGKPFFEYNPSYRRFRVALNTTKTGLETKIDFTLLR